MLASLIYVCAIVAANLFVAAFGPWVSPINSLLLIGLDLTLRDHLHDKWRGPWLWPRMFGIISCAGAVSYLINPASSQIAIASVVAFCAAALIDAAVYQIAIKKGFLLRSNASNAAGAMADSLIFPAIAFGGFLPYVIAMQFAAKLFGGFAWSLLILRILRKNSEKSLRAAPENASAFGAVLAECNMKSTGGNSVSTSTTVRSACFPPEPNINPKELLRWTLN